MVCAYSQAPFLSIKVDRDVFPVRIPVVIKFKKPFEENPNTPQIPTTK